MSEQEYLKLSGMLARLTEALCQRLTEVLTALDAGDTQRARQTVEDLLAASQDLAR